MAREPERHGRPIPQHVLRDVKRSQQLVYRVALRADATGIRTAGDKMRHNHPDVGVRLSNLDGRLPAWRIEQRFLHEKHTACACRTGHQVLRPLKHEIPPQVREADEIWR
jgi:hypothetical protein